MNSVLPAKGLPIVPTTLRVTAILLTGLVSTGLPLSPRRALAFPRNVAQTGTASASSSASPVGGKYGPGRANDGDPNTHWASGGKALPQWVRLDWTGPQRVDTVWVDPFSEKPPALYAAWTTAEVELSDGFKQRVKVDAAAQDGILLRFEQPHEIDWLTVHILDVRETKHYVGIDEVGAYWDPDRLIGPRKPIVSALTREQIDVKGQEQHPTVYINAEDLERAQRNVQTTEWGAAEKRKILGQAKAWLDHDEPYWLQFLPPPGASYAYGFVACPVCNSRWGTWAGASCSWDMPGTVTCAKGHELPDAQHPDDGTGWKNPDGRIHYFVGSWNAWVTELWTLRAIPALAHAYALTGEEQYAERAGFFLDALASIYAESASGSWDYPSRPPSGRFARPWYQVARNLVPFVEAYDLVYNSPSMQTPSLRPQLENTWPAGPTSQRRAVQTRDMKGVSWQGMTRRDNINKNLMEDGAYYCYSHTFSGALHNGHADYMRGALAVGVLLGIPEYVHNAIESPYSIYAMLANNVDRDGRYYETALGYAVHCRDLYLTFVEPLRNWRDERYPQGVHLFDDPRMRAFYRLPALGLHLCGHRPNFGDAGPDNRHIVSPDRPFDSLDYKFAERLHAGCQGEAKQEFGRLVRWLSGGDVQARRNKASFRRWLLYHADPLTGDLPDDLPSDLHRQVHGSWFLGQKGIGLLRDGEGSDAQGVFLRYGPSLNHGDRDDLGLIYYGQGWQATYEIGYGLGSTHTQVGWGSQTASHSIVAVNEQSQRGGSGGSLYLFARLPGLKIMEADSPLSYASQQVSQYRRTVALLGEGKDQVLIDLFRVKGGEQHDYIVGSQGQDFTVSGVQLGPEEEGSLAGAEIAWGQRQGPDGDILGHPNKPYWNPPPGTGYGFFYDVRRGQTSKPWHVDWRLGGPNDAHFRVHLLPAAQDEAMVAKAPGLYPFNRKASYLIQRRRGKNLTSCFASVMEPYSAPPVTRDPAAAKARTGEPQSVLSTVARLTVRGPSDFPATAIHVRRGDLDEYFLSAGLHDRGLSVDATWGTLRWSGAVAYTATRGGRVVKLALHGAGELTAGKSTMRVTAAAFDSTVTAIDYDAGWVETDASVPADGLQDEGIYFRNPRYSRNTAYRIEHIQSVPTGSRIHLGSQPMLLGQGRVHQIVSEDKVLSDIPHDYGRSVVGGNNPRFFDGKLLRTAGSAETNIKTIQYGSPLQITVDGTDKLKEGETLFYYDVQVGDRSLIPTSAWAALNDDGQWDTIATVDATLNTEGHTIRIPGRGLEHR